MKSSKTIKIVMEMITYISLVLYMFDVVLLGTGGWRTSTIWEQTCSTGPVSV